MFKNLSKCSRSNASERVVLKICQSSSSHASESRIKNLSKCSRSNASEKVVLKFCESLVEVIQVIESY